MSLQRRLYFRYFCAVAPDDRVTIAVLDKDLGAKSRAIQ